jgi:hypothetical protein
MKLILSLMLTSLIMAVSLLIYSIIEPINVEATIFSAILCVASSLGAAYSAKILDERKQF